MPFPPPSSQRISCHILTSSFSYYQLNEARDAHLCRSKHIVIHDELTPLFRDTDVLVLHMVERMFQHAIKISILLHHMKHPIARETVHLMHVSASLFRLHFGLLLVMVIAHCILAAFICLLDSSVLVGVFPLESN